MPVLIGSCSWKYPSWEGLVYSSREPPDYLAEYALRYDTVEVDQWFWSLGNSGVAMPRRETVAEYDAATPAAFRFTVKCPDAITLTHHRARGSREPRPNDNFLDPGLFMRFLEALAPLVPKIGLFIFQFEYLNKQKAPDRAAFMARLAEFMEALPADLPYAFEIRNPRWVDEAWFRLLAGRRAAPVLLQGYWMDPVTLALERFGGLIGDTFCVRLHGEDREGMDERSGSDWSSILRSKDDELAAIVPAVKALTGNGRKAFINVNNHYEGSAPITIGKIRKLLDES